MYKYFLLFVLLFSETTIKSYDNFKIGSKYFSLGGHSSTLTDIWSITNNQAGLAFIERPVVSSFYQNRFLIKELSTKSIGLAIPFEIVNAGIAFQYFGYSKYNEIKLDVCFARKFGDNVAAGIDFSQYFRYMYNYPRQKILYNLNIGLIWKASENITMGFHCINIIPYNNYYQTVPQFNISLVSGIRYYLNDNFSLLAQAELNPYVGYSINFGLEYNIIKNLCLETGINTHFSNPYFAFGFTYHFKKLKVGCSFYKNTYLPFSTSIEFSYIF